MSRAIWKYEFEVTDIVQAYDIPQGYSIVHVEAQGRHVCMWVDVNVEREKTERTFQIFGTGHPVPDDAAYIGTAQIGSFVWHLFEVIR